MELTLQVFYLTEEQQQLKDLGVDKFVIGECEHREATFYHINAISRYEEGEQVFCSIHTNGENFICVEPYAVVKERIEYLNQIKCKPNKSNSVKKPD